jgi:hypothetical protein
MKNAGKYIAKELIEARKASLIACLEGVTDIYAVIRSSSPSHMTKYIDLFYFDPDFGQMYNIGLRVAHVFDMKFNEKRNGIAVLGTGTNCALELVEFVSGRIGRTRENRLNCIIL